MAYSIIGTMWYGELYVWKTIQRGTIRPKSSFLFWLLDMSKIYQHVHRLELCFFIILCCALTSLKKNKDEISFKTYMAKI